MLAISSSMYGTMQQLALKLSLRLLCENKREQYICCCVLNISSKIKMNSCNLASICNYSMRVVKSFVENESYKHKMAKDVLREWFSGGRGIGDIRFEPNRKCGVWFEYPIVQTGQYDSIHSNWDGIINNPKINVENIEQFNELQSEFVPTYDDCVSFGIRPTRVIDVCLTHKGCPMWFIEICHKNPTSIEKINELKSLGMDNLIEIDAEWIMKQTKRPDEIIYKRLI
jgi:hypothetical protein